MSFPQSVTLLHPESEGGGGAETGGGQAEASQPAESSTHQTQTESTTDTQQRSEDQQAGSGRYVSNEEYQRLNSAAGKARAADQFYNQLKERGFSSFDEVIPHIDRMKQVQSDPRMRNVFDAMLQREEQDSSQTQAREPLTQDSIRQLIDQQFQQRERQQFQQQYNMAVERENELISNALRGEQLRGVFGDHGFDDALDGKAGEVPQVVATLLESELAARSPTMGNQKMPVTDPGVFNEAVSSVLKRLKAIRAHTLLEASTDDGSPDTPQSEQRRPDGPLSQSEWMQQQQERRRAASEYAQAELARQRTAGQPASRAM